jgi:hypothetical protein
LDGQTFNLSSALPPIQDGDTLDLRDIIIDGNNLTGDGTRFNDKYSRAFTGFDTYSKNNGGSGVLVDVGPTMIRRVRVINNQGDGILLEGPDLRSVEIGACFVGYDDTGTAAPNMGSGIHVLNGVRQLKIGQTLAVGGEILVVFVCGNRDHGIWLEGSIQENMNVEDVHIRATSVGMTEFTEGFGQFPVGVPNGMCGIYISGGAKDVLVGDMDPYLAVVSSGHVTGAGLLIEGPDTSDIQIVNSSWGPPPSVSPAPFGNNEDEKGNKYGIHVRGGCEASNDRHAGFPARQLRGPLRPGAL